jgi:GWxTD domain-containing protein
MATHPALWDECIGLLLAVYQHMGETGQAQHAVSEYMRGLDREAQALFQDVRLVASIEEEADFEALSEEERPEFERAFWQKRDPTPATPGNERLVEHYRRVLYAMASFSGGRKPWDKRGEIYIRYGEPAHKSRAGQVRYETDPEVVRVKERLAMGIPSDGRKEIVARMRRLETSTWDVAVLGEAGADVNLNAFETIRGYPLFGD